MMVRIKTVRERYIDRGRIRSRREADFILQKWIFERGLPRRRRLRLNRLPSPVDGFSGGF